MENKKEPIFSKKEISELYIKRMQEERIETIKERYRLSSSFDKYILTFATGLSVLIINSILSYQFLINTSYLVISLFLLVISIVCMVLSIYYSKKDFETHEHYLNNAISAEINSKEEPSQPCLDRKNELLENSGTVGFILGVIFAFMFYIQLI